MTSKAFAACALALLAAGCTHSRQASMQGQFVTDTGAGNAIAANTARQVVDPWPRESADVRLRVPSDRGGTAATAPAPQKAGSNIMQAAAGLLKGE